MRGTRLIGPLVLAALAVSACGDDDSATAGSDDRGNGAATADEAASATEYPLSVETCGDEWTYEQPPERVVTTDTPMLDLMLLLRLDDRIAGYFANDVDNVDPAVIDQARELTHLGDSFPYPSLESVLAGDPDLVLSYGYNPEAGFTAERLQDQGVNNFTWAEGCSDFSGTSTLDLLYDDVRTLGRIFDVSDRAEGLIAEWEARVAAVKQAAPDEPVAVLNTGSGDPAVPFASGGTGVTNEIIEAAGGENVFADVDDAFFEPTWEDVVARDPELIIESSGFGQEGLDAVQAHLEGNPALATMAAVQNDGFMWMRYEEGVPGPQLFNGMERIAEAIAEVRS